MGDVVLSLRETMVLIMWGFYAMAPSESYEGTVTNNTLWFNSVLTIPSALCSMDRFVAS